jgi:hypothetical protein
MMTEKPKWITPQIESLEINDPVICNKPWEQIDICLAQQEPQETIPCTPSQKGTANQPLS